MYSFNLYANPHCGSSCWEMCGDDEAELPRVRRLSETRTFLRSLPASFVSTVPVNSSVYTLRNKGMTSSAQQGTNACRWGDALYQG